MPFIGPWGWFYHIPKCGGVAIRQYLKAKYQAFGGDIRDIHALPAPEDDFTNAWTVVRHPAHWLLSFYTYNFENDWYWKDCPEEIRKPFEFAAGMFWPQWIKSVTEKIPGVVGRAFDLYAVPGVQVYQLRNIEQVLGGYVKPLNISEFKPAMSDDQWNMICEAEKETLKRYGYSN